MANLAVSAVCNQACAYCFTVDHLPRGAGRPAFISMAAFEERLDFLAGAGLREARLLGGEPTLHPQFPELVARARSAGLTIRVFSNGLMPEPALACLEALSPQDCTVLVNVAEPAAAADPAYVRRQATLRRLGRRALPGYTIYQVDFHLDFLLPLIEATGCQPTVRLGMAQPCLSGANTFIWPGQYRAVAARIAGWAGRAAGAGVTLDFDCGFVPCAFAEDDLAALRAARARPGWHCSPVLDVDVEGRVLHCFPLAGLLSLPLTPGADANTLHAALNARTAPYRQAGVFRECSACPLKAAGECPGGCLAATIRRFRSTPFRIGLPAGPAARAEEGVA